ncbi:MAG: 16S rRNA (cytidine(1402)-2'-O)-methyltransferase [Tenericutes bacterium]|jgi:16S rRNA (cytidine1402-2'-O)-methyltransferase|nr:16S rRNA (cytidine(1402)-2'-O)-methyltransferase [Mycoplasmatota bacterium]
MSQKSFNGQNALFIIPTPIGNMGDLSTRIIETIKLVDIIFCEDTRITGKLLLNLNIKKKLVSAHNYNEAKVKYKVLECLNNNLNVALMSDRGTPIISDPGYKIVEEIIKNGHNVIAIPGPTAFVPALVTSGLDASRFLFYGFLSKKNSKKKEELKSLISFPYTLIFYESPHRILETLKIIESIMGDRYISISREITKKFEEIYRGKITQVIEEIGEPKGEFVIIVSGITQIMEKDPIKLVKNYIEAGLDKKEALKIVAKDCNISKSELYKNYLRK